MDSLGPGSPHLILAQPATATQSRLLDNLADTSVADRNRTRFEPMVMAQDLATSVELLAAAIETIPTDRLEALGV
jgi:hypothetical protein